MSFKVNLKINTNKEFTYKGEKIGEEFFDNISEANSRILDRLILLQNTFQIKKSG
jgi:hypothetical protein